MSKLSSTRKSSSPPRCPANYFGKGENYNLADASPEDMARYNEEFQKWEEEHPDDPIGEKALEAYKLSNPNTTSATDRHKITSQVVVVGAGSLSSVETEDEEYWVPLRLMLPEEEVDKLKKFARRQGRRPRDIIQKWIKDYCH